MFGVEAAATELLGTRASDMAPGEAAMLAAVLPNPKRLDARAPSEYVQARRADIERQMRVLDERGHYAGLEW